MRGPRRYVTAAGLLVLCATLPSALAGLATPSTSSLEPEWTHATVASGSTRVDVPLPALPDARLANAAASHDVGPSEVRTRAVGIEMATTREGLTVRALTERALVPLFLLPDGSIYVAAGARPDDELLHAPDATLLLDLPRRAQRAPDPTSPARVEDDAAMPRAPDGAQASPPAAAAETPPLPPPARMATATAAAHERAGPLPTLATVTASLWILGLSGLLLYHRVRPNAALQNATRKRIFDEVCAHPGLGVQDVATAAGVSYSTAAYHLERLVQARMVVATIAANKLRYYKNGGAFTERERRLLPILQSPEAGRLLEAIARDPGTIRSRLADRLGVTTTTINWHLRRLLDARLVREERQGRSAHLYPTEDALGQLAALAGKIADATETAERLRRLQTSEPA